MDLQEVTLKPEQDLNDFMNNILDINRKLSWVGQGMSPGWLLNIITYTLGKSRYKTQLETLLAAHSAVGTSISDINGIIQYLSANDIFEGKAYGGAGQPTTTTTTTTTPSGTKPTNGRLKGSASAVQGEEDLQTEFTYHAKHHFIGALNLTAKQVAIKMSCSKCWLCTALRHIPGLCVLTSIRITKLMINVLLKILRRKRKIPKINLPPR